MALLGAHHIFHVNGLRVTSLLNCVLFITSFTTVRHRSSCPFFRPYVHYTLTFLHTRISFVYRWRHVNSATASFVNPSMPGSVHGADLLPLQILPISVHCTVMNEFKCTKKLKKKALPPRQWLGFNPLNAD